MSNVRIWLVLINVLILICVKSIECADHHNRVEQVLQDSSSRIGRIMTFLNEPKQVITNRHRVQVPRIRQRSDTFPQRSQNAPYPHMQRPVGPGNFGPQIVRRVHNGISPGVQRPISQNYQLNVPKASRYSPAKDAAIIDVAKNTYYRPEPVQHPNAINQYPSEQYLQNFKASQTFNGNVIVKEQRNQHMAQQQAPQQNTQYTSYSQHPLPEQNSYGSQLYQGYSIVPSKQTQVKPAQSNQGPSYSVYEEADPNLSNENQLSYYPSPPQPAIAASEHIVSPEAQDYLRFMNTNNYFLPKRDPNYKQIDVENDRLQYQKQLQYQQEQQVKSQIQTALPNLLPKDVAQTYNQPIQVSNLFFQQDPAPSSAAVVRGSYQAGQNEFVVKSDGNKAIKHIVSSVLPPQSSTPAPLYTQARHNSQRTHTPEPVRFEFTEQDAVSSYPYTNSPEQHQKLYYQTISSTPRTVESSTIPATTASLVKPINEITDDSEDSDDTNGGNIKQISLQNSSVLPTSTSPVEQKDTEEYCERICANVYDENDEIVCGSDGFMYTGEAQLECYSSCLHIDVSIKSKGSCSPI